MEDWQEYSEWASERLFKSSKTKFGTLGNYALCPPVCQKLLKTFATHFEAIYETPVWRILVKALPSARTTLTVLR